MKNIDNYIIEKFKISSDIKPSETIVDKYNIGDICIVLNYFQERNTRSHPGSSFVMIDVVKIIKETKISFICSYLTTIGHYKSDDKISIRKDREKMYEKGFEGQKCLISGNDYRKYSVLVPNNKCKEIIDYLEKNMSYTTPSIPLKAVICGDNLTDVKYKYNREWLRIQDQHFIYTTYSNTDKFNEESLEKIKSFFN